MVALPLIGRLPSTTPGSGVIKRGPHPRTLATRDRADPADGHATKTTDRTRARTAQPSRRGGRDAQHRFSLGTGRRDGPEGLPAMGWSQQPHARGTLWRARVAREKDHGDGSAAAPTADGRGGRRPGRVPDGRGPGGRLAIEACSLSGRDGGRLHDPDPRSCRRGKKRRRCRHGPGAGGRARAEWALGDRGRDRRPAQ